MQLPEHGANAHIVYERLGMTAHENVLDFSENVNPAGPPEAVLKRWAQLVSKLKAYPDPSGEPFLSAAAKFHDIEKASLFIGNGAAELLSLLAERYRGKKAVVVHPTFSEYETTLTVKNVEIVQVCASASAGFRLPLTAIMAAMGGASVLYLCTPNNPTGIMPSSSELLEIITHGREVNCEIVLDEAFIDFVDESRSFISNVSDFPHVIVVRSMTKMYAIPGIRLGYVVAHPNIIEEIKALAPHWNVNGIAAQIGAVCLEEKEYCERAIAHSDVEREQMKVFLENNGCSVTDAAANFLSFTLGEGRQPSQLYKDMLLRGIVLRHSENFKGMDGKWLRIGMKNSVDMERLKKELSQWFADN